MKTYNKHNFFKHTYCEFTQCNETVFKLKTIHYTSKKGSKYSYTDDGVYRYANHWGRVANCRWKIEQKEGYKNQRFFIGFSKWTDFYPLNETGIFFYITVCFDTKSIQIHHIKNKDEEAFFLFSLIDAQKRKKQINHLLTTDKWAKYFSLAIDELRKRIVFELITTDKSLQEIKIKIKIRN